jgi:hypothetical protein
MAELLNPKGFVILPRIRIENTKDKMIYILLFEKANFTDSENCNRGELITSKSKLEEETGWKYGAIRGSMDRLEKMGLILQNTLPAKKGTKVTITNYSYYQDLNNYKSKDKLLIYEDNNECYKDKDKQKNNETEAKIPIIPMLGEDQQQVSHKPNNKVFDNPINNLECNTITEYFNKIIEQHISNKKERTLANFLKATSISDFTLKDNNDVEIFIDFVINFNTSIASVNHSLLMEYLKCIRENNPSNNVKISKVLSLLIFFEN